MFTPLLPKRPLGGNTNAVGSNHRSTVRSPRARPPFPIRSGKPPKVFVLDGSEPEKAGEKKVPLPKKLIEYNCHPPTTWSIIPGPRFRNFVPRPNGKSYMTVTTARCFEVKSARFQK